MKSYTDLQAHTTNLIDSSTGRNAAVSKHLYKNVGQSMQSDAWLHFLFSFLIHALNTKQANLHIYSENKKMKLCLKVKMPTFHDVLLAGQTRSRGTKLKNGALFNTACWKHAKEFHEAMEALEAFQVHSLFTHLQHTVASGWTTRKLLSVALTLLNAITFIAVKVPGNRACVRGWVSPCPIRPYMIRSCMFRNRRANYMIPWSLITWLQS